MLRQAPRTDLKARQGIWDSRVFSGGGPKRDSGRTHSATFHNPGDAHSLNYLVSHLLWLKHRIVQAAAPSTPCSFAEAKGQSQRESRPCRSKCTSVFKCAVCRHLRFKAPVCSGKRAHLPSKLRTEVGLKPGDMVASWNPCSRYSEARRCSGQAA